MNYKSISLFLLTVLCVLSFNKVTAQSGRDWVTPGQQYYKIEIGENNIYKIDHTSLAAAGLPLSTINPKNIQLFKNGEEQHIYVSGEQDNSFDPSDFIEFYGEKNDGKLDEELYLDASQQPHQYMSLYTDTTNYYLTWSNTTPGKRNLDYYNNNYSGKTSDSWIWHSSVMYFSTNSGDNFYDGSPFGLYGSYSEYTTGEGWFGTMTVRGSRPVFNVNTEKYNSAGPAPELSFGVYSKSNPAEYEGGFNHKLEVSINDDLLFERSHTGYNRIETGINAPKITLASSMVGEITPVAIQSTLLARGRHVPSFFKIDYPRNLSLDGKDYFEFDYKSTNDYFEFSDFSGTDAIIYDVNNNLRIQPDILGSTLKFQTPDASKKKIIISKSSNVVSIAVSNIKETNFYLTDYSNTSYDYLIVTHPRLTESAQEYKAYRESVKGGGHDVLIVYTPDLYESYYYGLKHPLAIKNFCKDIYTSQSTPPKHLLMLGKGRNYQSTRFNYLIREYENLVPTWGTPGTDYPFVTDYTPNNLAPLMGVGRIPARDNDDVRKYLYKIKLHEDYSHTSKDVLFLTGGVGISEQSLLQSKQRVFYAQMQGTQFGADSIMVEKKDAEAIDGSLIQNIQGHINDGVNAVSYFGHGASQVLELDIGKPNQMDNEGKYPLFIFNGCALGNSFDEISLPEEFLFEDKKGAIGWIASSALGFIEPLSNWSTLFHNNLYNTHYGKSIGEIISITTDGYQNPDDNFNRVQCRQMTFHGDPALKLFAPEKPDYQVAINAESGLFPTDANAELDSFALQLDLTNAGRAVLEEPQVFVSLKYSNDSVHTFGPRTFGPIHNNLPVQFWLPVTAYSAGFQTATITVDYGDSIEELSPLGETNNVIDYEFLLPSNRLFVLSPKKDDIQPSAIVELMVQNNNLRLKGNEVIFQIDTTPFFNSSILQTSQTTIADNIISHKFTLPPLDSTDFYWRATFAQDINNDAAWVGSTFALIFDSEQGWSQGHFPKLGEAQSDGIEVHPSDNKLTFKKRLGSRYDVWVGGDNIPYYQKSIIIDNNKSSGRYARNQVEILAINPANEDRYFEENNPYNVTVPSWGAIPGKKYYELGEKAGVYLYRTTLSKDRDSLIALLDRIPENYYLFMLLNGNVALNDWPEELFEAFEEYGASKIRIINPGDPYGLIGVKGSAPGSAIEAIADYSSAIDPKDVQFSIATQLFPYLSEGSLTSWPVGPSKKWKQFYKITGDEYDNDADTVTYSIIGVGNDGTDSIFFEDITAKTTNISNINADRFQYLKVKATYKDGGNYTPAAQQRWTVLYDGVPEGSLMPEIAFEQTHDTIQEGDTIGFKIAYKNISKFDMDSLLVLALNRNSDDSKDTIDYKFYQPLAPGDSIILSYKMPTLGLNADNAFLISVNPLFQQPEELLENNFINLRYRVEKDNKNPLLDVVFDGVHILDYDIVAPTPVITMSVLDENKFLFINDPNAFTATITHLDEFGNPTGQVDSILHTLATANFYPAAAAGEKAILEYMPMDLPSGKYRLDVAVIDASGNSSSELNYTIRFEIIRESQITNIYPYPNPFTTSMKFIYTLTGEQIPDYMKIQILTVTGKVVREITQDELGLIRIGDNISEFTWNGTDEFGDQLANGVYLYKVTAKINGEDIKHRETKGDQYFNKGYGKIYLMR